MKKAFTLIELLVVIAIIAILAAILFPVFAQAKAAAKTSACLSNTKQIGLGTMQYVADADGAYPQNWFGDGDPFWQFWWQTHPTTGPNAGPAYKWIDAIYPYVKSEAIFTCPSNNVGGEVAKYINRANLTRRMPISETDAASRRFGTYCSNSAYWDASPGTPASSDRGTGLTTESSLGDPAGTVWAADGNGSFQCSWPSIAGQPPSPPLQALPKFNGVEQLGILGGNHALEGAIVFRHQNRANIVWTDGHAKSSTSGDLTQKVTDNTKNTVGAFRRFTVEED